MSTRLSPHEEVGAAGALSLASRLDEGTGRSETTLTTRKACWLSVQPLKPPPAHQTQNRLSRPAAKATVRDPLSLAPRDETRAVRSKLPEFWS